MTHEDELDDVIVKALCVYYEYGTPAAEFKWMAMDVRKAIKAAGWAVVRKPEDRSAEWDALKANAPVDPWFQQPETD